VKRRPAVLVLRVRIGAALGHEEEGETGLDCLDHIHIRGTCVPYIFRQKLPHARVAELVGVCTLNGEDDYGPVTPIWDEWTLE
jgi:hypothetical protein